MRVKKFPESGPKRRMLDAAEVLFAERGFEAVSVRDITSSAEANVAAVNYHFGSREDLIDLLIIHYANPVNEERLARLEAVERKWSGKAIPLEEVCEAYLRPLQGVTRKSKLAEPLLQKLLGRIFALPCESLPPTAQQLLLNAGNRFLKALSKALPSLTGEELAWRAHFVEGAMIHMLMGQDPLRNTTATPPTTEALLGRLIRFAAAGLREGVESDPAAKKGPQSTFDF
jgi:AcrR family transcriptional regulator